MTAECLMNAFNMTEYQPYQWMGEDANAHVEDWRQSEQRRERTLGSMVGSSNYQKNYEYSMPWDIALALSETPSQRYLLQQRLFQIRSNLAKLIE